MGYVNWKKNFLENLTPTDAAKFETKETSHDKTVKEFSKDIRTMAKKIIFFVDLPKGVHTEDCALTYADTEDTLQWWIENTDNPNSLVKYARFMYTTSLAHLSFDWLEYGFEIYVVQNEKVLQLKPGMNNVHNKDIKKTHNILKLFISGFFDEDFKNGKDWEEFSKNFVI